MEIIGLILFGLFAYAFWKVYISVITNAALLLKEVIKQATNEENTGDWDDFK